MEIKKAWAMPNKNTFDIKPIKEIIKKYIKNGDVIVDPFANKNRIATICNDIDPEYHCDYCMDANDFLTIFDKNSIDVILFDPPYSPRQVTESYKKLGLSVNMETTQGKYWTMLKKIISTIIKPGGIVISCAWNSGGIGKKYGFEQIEILLVAHGGWHNDTIITIERKMEA